MPTAQPEVDKALWFMHAGCTGRHYILGNAHTVPGRVLAWCPKEQRSLFVSKSDMRQILRKRTQIAKSEAAAKAAKWRGAMVRQLLEPLPLTPEQPVSAGANREELARLRAEAEARRQEDERKAAAGRAAEEARLATERAEIAKQREGQEAKARAERAELERQAAELRAQQEVVRKQQEAVAAETKHLEDERIAAEQRAAEEAIEADAHRIEQEPNQSEPAEAPRSTQTTLDFGVMKDDILNAFPRPIRGQTDEQWANMLADARAKWLKPARVDRGGRGVQSRWNPAQLAMCLAEKGHMQRKALGDIIRRDFPKYLSEWESYAGRFERR